MKNTPRGFRITDCKGFHITFKSGVTVSIQFGGGNYCQNHDKLNLISHAGEVEDGIRSLDAEVAIWNNDGVWITKEFRDDGDDVIGYQTPEEILEILNWASQYNTTKVDDLAKKEIQQ